MLSQGPESLFHSIFSRCLFRLCEVTCIWIVHGFEIPLCNTNSHNISDATLCSWPWDRCTPAATALQQCYTTEQLKTKRRFLRIEWRQFGNGKRLKVDNLLHSLRKFDRNVPPVIMVTYLKPLDMQFLADIFLYPSDFFIQFRAKRWPQGTCTQVAEVVKERVLGS